MRRNVSLRACVKPATREIQRRTRKKAYALNRIPGALPAVDDGTHTAFRRFFTRRTNLAPPFAPHGNRTSDAVFEDHEKGEDPQ